MRLLIVDDDVLAAEMTAAILDDGGHVPVIAEGGTDALSVLAGDRDFDAVVSDMNMPGMTGLELFRALRAGRIDLPFILLSGDDPNHLKHQEPGLTACVLKDFDLGTTLAAALARLPAEMKRHGA